MAPLIRAAPEGGAAGVSLEAPEAVELEKIALPALTPIGRIGIALYLAAFVAMFLLVLFPAFFSGALGQLHAGWAVAAPPADFEGKSLGVRSLMAISLLAIPFLLSFFFPFMQRSVG